MVQIEIVKANIDDCEDQTEQSLRHGTNILCRLVQPWNGSERVVCADSYFSSVTTAGELSRRGLKFIGIVKGATRKYPISFLSGVEALGRHCHTTCVRKSHAGEIEMAAVLWIDRERRYFVSTASSTTPGTPCRRLRWRQTESGVCSTEIEFTPPKVVQLYYSICLKSISITVFGKTISILRRRLRPSRGHSGLALHFYLWLLWTVG